MIHPSFVEEIKKILPADQIDTFLDACARPLKKSISLCENKINVHDFMQLTKPRGRHLVPNPLVPNSLSFYIDRDDTSTALGNTFLHQAGFFYIQELAASLPATQIDVKPNDLILDLAAAPGGKSIQLAHALLTSVQKNQGGPGLVIANDIVPARIKTLAHNLNQTGSYNSAITKRNGAMFGRHVPELFDHVLVDAPCSGEGTKYKSDSALTFWRKEEINKITGTQFQLLVSAVKATKPGGTIVYSTCTLNPYENEGVIEQILSFFKGAVELDQHSFVGVSPGVSTGAQDSNLDLHKIARCRPHLQGTGGFFVAKLRKVSSTKKPYSTHESKVQPKNPFSLDMSKSLYKRSSKELEDNYGIKLDPEKHFFIASKEVVYLTSPAFVQIQPILHVEKAGIPLFKIDRDLLRPTHFLGNILGHLATKNVITFDNELMQRYSQGDDIELGELGLVKQPSLPYQIIRWREYGMSVVKLLPDGIKNKWGK